MNNYCKSVELWIKGSNASMISLYCAYSLARPVSEMKKRGLREPSTGLVDVTYLRIKINIGFLVIFSFAVLRVMVKKSFSLITERASITVTIVPSLLSLTLEP